MAEEISCLSEISADEVKEILESRDISKEKK